MTAIGYADDAAVGDRDPVSYPAFTTFFADPERTTARICVFMALQPPLLSHTEPRDMKVDVVRRAARVSEESARASLAWLIARGYLVLHRRNPRGVASLTLARAVSLRFPSCVHLPPARWRGGTSL